jgi:O-acetyl-ADP-ribose deacetylase (regulator of RNase III)
MTKIQLVHGDITTFRADVIVNAANSSLLGGGGVDGAIHAAGGATILQETQRLRSGLLADGLPPGKAVATTAGTLPAKWVVHTVGPVYSPSEDRSRVLRSSYTESMLLAEKLGALTIAFPAISAGVYGWPLPDAARIAIETVAEIDNHITLATFVLYNENALAAFTTELARVSPPVV